MYICYAYASCISTASVSIIYFLYLSFFFYFEIVSQIFSNPVLSFAPKKELQNQLQKADSKLYVMNESYPSVEFLKVFK